jgi:hypothetical protein
MFLETGRHLKRLGASGDFAQSLLPLAADPLLLGFFPGEATWQTAVAGCDFHDPFQASAFEGSKWVKARGSLTLTGKARDDRTDLLRYFRAERASKQRARAHSIGVLRDET